MFFYIFRNISNQTIVESSQSDLCRRSFNIESARPESGSNNMLRGICATLDGLKFTNWAVQASENLQTTAGPGVQLC